MENCKLYLKICTRAAKQLHFEKLLTRIKMTQQELENY